MKALKTELLAIVSGVVRWNNNKPFTHKVRFTLIPPKDGEQHYGTGCYLHMEILDEKGCDQHYDVRYLGTSDIRKLAKMVAKDYWGENLTDYKEV